MRIWVQRSASMQKRMSPLKYGHLSEKSGFNSVSSIFQLRSADVLALAIASAGATLAFSALALRLRRRSLRAQEHGRVPTFGNDSTLTSAADHASAWLTSSI